MSQWWLKLIYLISRLYLSFRSDDTCKQEENEDRHKLNILDDLNLWAWQWKKINFENRLFWYTDCNQVKWRLANEDSWLSFDSVKNGWKIPIRFKIWPIIFVLQNSILSFFLKHNITYWSYSVSLQILFSLKMNLFYIKFIQSFPSYTLPLIVILIIKK